VLVFEPMKTLQEYDGLAKVHGKGSAYYEATGDEGRKMFADFAQNDLQFVQRDFLAFAPAMSVVSDKVIAANPDFWRPKTAMAKAPAAKKEPAKTEKK